MTHATFSPFATTFPQTLKRRDRWRKTAFSSAISSFTMKTNNRQFSAQQISHICSELSWQNILCVPYPPTHSNSRRLLHCWRHHSKKITHFLINSQTLIISDHFEEFRVLPLISFISQIILWPLVATNLVRQKLEIRQHHKKRCSKRFKLIYLFTFSEWQKISKHYAKSSILWIKKSRGSRYPDI